MPGNSRRNVHPTFSVAATARRPLSCGDRLVDPHANAPRQKIASVETPIAADSSPRYPSRGFLPWRFAYAGPRRVPRHHHGAGIRKPSQEQTFSHFHFHFHTLNYSLLSWSIEATARRTAELLVKFQFAYKTIFEGGYIMRKLLLTSLCASVFFSSSAALAVSCTQQGETCKGWASGQGF